MGQKEKRKKKKNCKGMGGIAASTASRTGVNGKAWVFFF